MSMSTHVIGFAPPDQEWQHMKDIWDACTKAKIEVPLPVQKFFCYSIPDATGVAIPLPLKRWNDQCREGFDIHVSEIPTNCKVIRFYNSY